MVSLTSFCLAEVRSLLTLVQKVGSESWQIASCW